MDRVDRPRRRTCVAAAFAALLPLAACSAILGIDDPQIEGAILPGVDSGSPDRTPTGDGAPVSETSTPDAPTKDGPTPDAGPIFIDDFNRIDGAPGNGWIEKEPGDWVTSGGRLVTTKPAPFYLDQGLYRPFSEAVLDVEVSVAFKLSALPPGFVQLHARVPASAITTAGQSDGYSIYVPNSTTEARLFRSRTAVSTDLMTLGLSEALNTTDSYRLRLRVTGTSPVALEGWVERATNPGFVVIGHATASDSDPTKRFDQPGTVNLALDTNANASYDDFTRTPL